MAAIRRPGVEITQEFVTESASIIEPTQAACIIGPCFRVVDAFDDGGEAQSEALAGTYQDGNGLVAYDIPGMEDTDDLTSLDDEMRVFLVVGSTTTELNSEDDEEAIVDDGTGDFDASSDTLTDVDVDFVSLGVEAGDVVRLAWRGVTYDIEITAVAATVLTLDTSAIDEDLTGVTYDVVRNPAQWILSTGTQASFRVGTAADYLAISANEDGDIAGSLGDGVSVVLEESTVYVDRTDGATGDVIFIADTGDFTTDVGAAGSVTGFHVLIYDTPLGNINGEVLREVLWVVDGTTLLIETGEGVGLTAKDYVIGESFATGSNGATDPAGSNFTSAGATTFLQLSGGVPGAPTVPTYIEIEGNGVYQISNVANNTQVALASNATGNLVGQTYRIITKVASGADGETGTLSDFVSPGATFQTTLAGLTPADLGVVVSGTSRTIATIVSEKHLTMTDAFLASADDITFELVEEAAPLTLAWDDEDDTLTVTLARTAGVTSSTFAQIRTAITSALDPAYDATVAGLFTAALGGTTGNGATAALVYVGTYTLDGGSDDNQLLVDADLIGSTVPTGKIYVSYRALRVDVSAGAVEPALLSFDDSDDIEDQIGEITTRNPLALGAYFAVLNSGSSAVKAIGVSEISSTKPNGTAEAYAEALSFLEGQDVYCLVPLTQDPTVLALVQTHVDSMSEPANKSERIGFLNRDMPDYSTAETVASGTQGNTGASFNSAGTRQFTSSTDFSAAGVVAGDILVVSSLAEYDASLTAVNGTAGPLYGLVVAQVNASDDYTLDVTVPAGVSADWNSLVDVSFTVYRAGSAITSASSQADAIEDFGPAYEDRRIVVMWPDTVVADVDGTSSVIEGYYLAAAWAGKLSGSSPAQGFSNVTVAGFTSLKHANGYFSESLLDDMAGSGLWINIQESSGAPIKCRHQLATDVSSIQRREVSVTRVIDYVAKFLRLALSKKVGRFNITQQFLDSLSTQIQSLGRYLVESQILASFKLTGIAPNEDQPDTIDITVVISPFYPANYIALTLQV